MGFPREIDIAKELEDCDTSNTNSEVILKRNALNTFREYKNRIAEIKTWTVTEDSIIVRTKKYSGIVLTIAIAIIGGSLSVPFVGGGRIAGVGPFHFLTVGWL